MMCLDALVGLGETRRQRGVERLRQRFESLPRPSWVSRLQQPTSPERILIFGLRTPSDSTD